MFKETLNDYYKNKSMAIIWFILLLFIMALSNSGGTDTNSSNKLYYSLYLYFAFYSLPTLQILYFLIKLKKKHLFRYIYFLIILSGYLHLTIKFGLSYTNDNFEFFALLVFFASLICNTYIMKYLNKTYQINHTMAINLFFSFLLYFPVGIWLMHTNFKALNNIVNKEDTLHE